MTIESLLKKYNASDIWTLTKTLGQVQHSNTLVLMAFHELLPGHDRKFSSITDPRQREVIDRYLNTRKQLKVELDFVKQEWLRQWS